MSKQVFLSSTAKDLSHYRDAVFSVVNALDGYHCIRMEDFGSRDSAAEAFCRAKVQTCDLMIGIVGHLYGSSPPDSELSFTEIEYEAAVRCDPPVACLMFIAPDDLALVGRESDDRYLKQQAFRSRVREQRIRAEFRSPESLQAEVLKAIRNWEAQRVTEGLAALRDMAVAPQVRAEVAGYEVAFRIASREIDSLVAYKDIHDQLHDLQFRCFDMIVREQSHFPASESLANLQIHEIALGEIIDELRRISVRVPSQKRGVDWIEEMIRARSDLQDALNSSAADRLVTAIRRLGRVLAIQPSDINTRLTSSARSIRLEELLDSLSVLRDKLKELGVDPAKLQSFVSSVEEVSAMKASLEELTTQHDHLQNLENQVRRIENTRYVQEELQFSWEHLDAVAQLVTDKTEAFVRDAERLAADLKGSDAEAVAAAFRLYRRRVGTMFHHADSELKSRCQDLRSLGTGLKSVLARLQ